MARGSSAHFKRLFRLTGSRPWRCGTRQASISAGIASLSSVSRARVTVHKGDLSNLSNGALGRARTAARSLGSSSMTPAGA
jgi:hypothetical protein